eukprot:jgi/Botrbrau1/915/Bobra.0167s0030.1
MVCPLRFVLVAVSAVIAIAALWQVNGPNQTTRQLELSSDAPKKDRKGFWRTALSWFTGEYVWDALRQWRTMDLIGKGKL